VFATEEDSMRRSLLAFSLLLAMAPQLAWADALSDGIDLVKKGDYERAVTLLKQYAEAHPDDPRPYLHLEKAYEGLYRPTLAIDAHQMWQELRKKAARPKPTPRPVIDDSPLPPVYVRPGPRTRLPVITNDMIPKQPTVYKATPLDEPKPQQKSATASDSGAKGAVVPPATPSPSAAPTPAPNLEPILEPTGFNAPPVAPPPLPAAN
jgi:tetratricopeptide (TPR) repeat protein